MADHRNLNDFSDAIDLLNALKANPTFTSGEPSPSFVQFLDRIENTIPSIADDEDETNESWGHTQFTSGQLKCTSVLDTWASVGSPSFAARLIAAALTTCRVSRWLCQTNRPTMPSSYLSDSYLNETCRLLWACWKSAGGVSALLFFGWRFACSFLNGQPIVKGKEQQILEEHPSALSATPSIPLASPPTPTALGEVPTDLNPSSSDQDQTERASLDADASNADLGEAHAAQVTAPATGVPMDDLKKALEVGDHLLAYKPLQVSDIYLGMDCSDAEEVDLRASTNCCIQCKEGW